MCTLNLLTYSFLYVSPLKYSYLYHNPLAYSYLYINHLNIQLFVS